jgi:hypothetical protein
LINPPYPHFDLILETKIGTSPEKDINGLERRKSSKRRRFGKHQVIDDASQNY